MKKKTPRKILEDKLKDLITEKLLIKCGPVCKICGKEYKLTKNGKCKDVGQFHILPKGGQYANLKYRPENIIQAGWWCCHYPFHHDYYKALDEIIPQLKTLLGNNYEERLKTLSKRLPKTTIVVLEQLYDYWNRR